MRIQGLTHHHPLKGWTNISNYDSLTQRIPGPLFIFGFQLTDNEL